MGNVFSVLFIEAHDEIKLFFPFKNGSCAHARESHRERFVEFSNVQPVFRDHFPIVLHGHLRQSVHFFHGNIGRALHVLNRLFDFECRFVEFIQVIAENLDGQIRTHAGNQLVEPHLNRLGELVVDSCNVTERHLKRIRQSIFRLSRHPFLFGLEFDDHIALLHGHRIGWHFRRANARNRLIHFWKSHQNLLDKGRCFNRF